MLRNCCRSRSVDQPPRLSESAACVSNPSHDEIVADAAYLAARAAHVSAIVVFTTSGSTARLVSRYRPPVPIYAVTPSETAARRC